jgi:hypothetical protein
MMKQFFNTTIFVFFCLAMQAQKTYPDIEFSNEVYYLKKGDSAHTVMRLEKESSKMETKTKLGGMGGAENGYTIDGEHSAIRLNNGNSLSFVFSTGSTKSSSSSAASDSMMRANGMDPAMMQNFSAGGTDPSNSITLYKVESGKGKRKVLLMKSPGAMPFGSKKMKSSDKYSFSVKKIREGYWELVIDKPLPRGEYAFSMMAPPSAGAMDMGVSLFAFGID